MSHQGRGIKPQHIIHREKILPLKDHVLPKIERPEVEYNRKLDNFTIHLGKQKLSFLSEQVTAIISLLTEALKMRGDKK